MEKIKGERNVLITVKLCRIMIKKKLFANIRFIRCMSVEKMKVKI